MRPSSSKSLLIEEIKKKKIEESVELTPNTVFSGLGDTEGFLKKKKKKKKSTIKTNEF